MLIEIREWTMLVLEFYICWILTMEYFYDFRKDEEKKQKKTRTTKKTTTQPSGVSVIEESTETIEGGNNETKEKEMP